MLKKAVRIIRKADLNFNFVNFIFMNLMLQENLFGNEIYK